MDRLQLQPGNTGTHAEPIALMARAFNPIGGRSHE